MYRKGRARPEHPLPYTQGPEKTKLPEARPESCVVTAQASGGVDKLRFRERGVEPGCEVVTFPPEAKEPGPSQDLLHIVLIFKSAQT